MECHGRCHALSCTDAPSFWKRLGHPTPISRVWAAWFFTALTSSSCIAWVCTFQFRSLLCFTMAAARRLRCVPICCLSSLCFYVWADSDFMVESLPPTVLLTQNPSVLQLVLGLSVILTKTSQCSLRPLSSWGLACVLVPWRLTFFWGKWKQDHDDTSSLLLIWATRFRDHSELTNTSSGSQKEPLRFVFLVTLNHRKGRKIIS